MRTLLSIIVITLLGFAPSANAQEAPIFGVGAGPTWGWQVVGPRRGGSMVAVAVSPRDPNRWAALSERGEVWLTEDGGTTWMQSLSAPRKGLGSLSSDEDMTRDIEASVEDLVQQDSVELEEDDPEADIGDLQTDAIEVAVDDIRAELDAHPVASAKRLAASGLWFGPGGELFAGRGDGLYLLSPGAQSWTHVLEEATAALTHVESRDLWLAGTVDGVRYAVDPRAWMDADDGTEGVGVWELVAIGARVWAATTDGALVARDAQTWRAFPELPGSVDQVERVDDGVLLLQDGALHRLGATGLEEETRALPGGADHFAVLADGSIAALGDGGAWVFEAGTWRALRGGASAGGVRQVAVAGDALVVAASGGVLKWVVDAPAPEQHVVSAQWMSLEELVDGVLHRPELMVPAAAHTGKALYTALPKVWLDGYFDLREGQRWSPSGGTTDNRVPDHAMRVIFEWQPPGRKGGIAADSDYEDLADLADTRARGADVLVIGDSVVVDDGKDTASLALLLERGAVEYRGHLVDELQRYYDRRTALVASRGADPRVTLGDQVAYELELQEVEAQLDVLSGGAVGRWRALSGL